MKQVAMTDVNSIKQPVFINKIKTYEKVNNDANDGCLLLFGIRN
jgi:hypothetical protein